MAFTNEDKQFIVSTVTDIVTGIVKDEVRGSEARVTKKIIGLMDEKFAKVDEQFKKVDEQFVDIKEDFGQLSIEVATAVNQDYDELKDCQRRVKRLETRVALV